MESKHKAIRTLLLLLAGLAGLAVLFSVYGVSVWKGASSQSLFRWLYMMWSSESTEAVDYSHGVFVPLVSLWLLWRQRDKLQKAFANPAPHPIGVVLCTAALVMHAAGLRMQIPHLSALGFVTALWGLVWTFAGVDAARVTLFPVVFLCFAIPVGFLSRVTFPLRMLGSVSATVILNGLGIATTREGTAVFSSTGQGFAMDVADACSGIRSMATLTALTAAYAYVFRQRQVERWLLFLLSVPIAAIANIGRIVTIAIVAVLFGQEFGMSIYHDWSGYLIFVLAVLLLVGTNALMDKVLGKVESRNKTED